MTRWYLSYCALSLSVAAALLAACGGPEPPIAMPQSLAISPDHAGAHNVRSASSLCHTLYSFGSASDGDPVASLIDVNGTLYGTTAGGYGTVFSISTSGREHVLHSFEGSPNGMWPFARLINVKGTLYGTTFAGGTYGSGYGHGTVFTISTTGKERVLYSFGNASDGAEPAASLIDVKGILYGTTKAGGTYGGQYGYGTVFSISSGGAEHVLHNFSGSSDGFFPVASLINVNGTLYGTTELGGQYGFGTVFSISTGGTEHVVYNFAGKPDGGGPEAALTDVKGTLYGTTRGGGTNGQGTVFSVTRSGAEHVVHSFYYRRSRPHHYDGNYPEAGLIDVNGTLYGTTTAGGYSNGGTVFSIDKAGKEHVLCSFGGTVDGTDPQASLINVNGALYGTTEFGGSLGQGIVFTLTL